MDEFEIAVVEAAMDCAKAQHAIDCGTPAQHMLKKATDDLMSASADLAAENEGDWRTPEPTQEFTLRRFHNALRVMLNVDMDEFIQAVFGKDFGESGEDEKAVWRAFVANPHMWLIRAGSTYEEKFWAYMQERMKP